MTRTEAWAYRGVVVVVLLGALSFEMVRWFPPIGPPSCTSQQATLIAKEEGNLSAPMVLIVQPNARPLQVLQVSQDPEGLFTMVHPGESVTVRACAEGIVAVAAYGFSVSTQAGSTP